MPRLCLFTFLFSFFHFWLVVIVHGFKKCISFFVAIIRGVFSADRESPNRLRRTQIYGIAYNYAWFRMAFSNS